jgi:tyrosine-protein phosphatase YwqE
MINWIKKFFVTEEKETKRPKCASCGLGATKYMLIEFQSLELEEIEEKIMIKICDGCYDEIYERYNPNWLPPPVQAKVLE